ncbi:cytochrome c [Aureliella helgolandensis]|nr:cytochrome c [Aureliella helgolandensis]
MHPKLHCGHLFACLRYLCIAMGSLWLPTSSLWSQSTTKPLRSAPPNFESAQFDSVFYADPASMLRGELPQAQATRSVASGSPTSGNSAANNATPSSNAVDPQAWERLISPTAIEDLIKGSKLRLDKVVTTQPAFVAGGYAVARKEFSLQALLFAIIEKYPSEVRWKQSAPAARELMARVAANTKIGSQQVYSEAKNRMLDLGDLLSGTQLSYTAKSDVDWAQLIDRIPLMQLLEWAYQEHITTYSASPKAFEQDKELLQRYAELIAVLGKASLQEEMPDATDADYQEFAQQMIAAALEIQLAVKTGDAELARQASGRIGSSCTNCHDSFR